MNKPKVIKPQDQTTNAQRRQAAALIKSFREKAERHEMTLKLGESLFHITISKKVAENTC